MEKQFQICQGELNIPCKLSAPDYGDIRRVVLGVHGLAGSANDEIQAGLAEEMALFRAATLRFDFPAHGENPDDTLCLQSCVDTLLAVAQHAKAQYPDVEDLCIFATGFGAYVTLIALQELLELPGRVKLVIIPGTSHRFMEDGAWDMVLDLTRDWFEFEQVLLADWD